MNSESSYLVTNMGACDKGHNRETAHDSRTAYEWLGVKSLLIREVRFLPELCVCSRPFRIRSILLAFVLCTVPWVPPIQAETIAIHGHYSYAQYNPKNGSPYTNQQGSFRFLTIISGMTWKICVTNVADASIWETVIYDGTNTFTFIPYSAPFFEERDSRTNTMVVTVYRSPWLFSYPYSSLLAHMPIPWLAYGLNPHLAKPNSLGLVDIPLSGARITPLAYGWAWEITSSQDGRFVAKCTIARETKLDIAHSKELLRPEMDYPENIGEKTEDLTALDHRLQVTNGFINTEYECSEWLVTNGLSIPMKSAVIGFLNGFPKRPYEIASLVADRVDVTTGNTNLLVPPDATRVVHDYRYKASNRSRIFRYAEYALAPGQAWKGPDDPVLLAKAQDWLKHGRRYSYYDYSYWHIVVWVVVVCIFSAPLLFILLGKRKHQKQESKDTNYERIE
jgi:hypothetical protein